ACTLQRGRDHGPMPLVDAVEIADCDHGPAQRGRRARVAVHHDESRLALFAHGGGGAGLDSFFADPPAAVPPAPLSQKSINYFVRPERGEYTLAELVNRIFNRNCITSLHKGMPVTAGDLGI